jgi:hypothetical protein
MHPDQHLSGTWLGHRHPAQLQAGAWAGFHNGVHEFHHYHSFFVSIYRIPKSSPLVKQIPHHSMIFRDSASRHGIPPGNCVDFPPRRQAVPFLIEMKDFY